MRGREVRVQFSGFAKLFDRPVISARIEVMIGESGSSRSAFSRSAKASRILARITRKPVPPTIPGFCQVDPTEVQVGLIHDHRLTSLNYYGYDMFERSAIDTPMRVYLRNGAGVEQDVSFAIGLPTHYLMTINVSDSRINYSNEGGEKLIVRYGTTEAYTINVIPPPPPGVSVSKFGVVFYTLDDNKDPDTGITLEINNVTVWSMPQEGGIAREFAKNHADPYPFPQTTPLADLPGKRLKICIQPKGDDTWRFNMRLYGSRSDSSDFREADTVRNCVFNSPELKCYISDHNNVTLTHDDPCQEWVLGSGSVSTGPLSNRTLRYGQVRMEPRVRSRNAR
jgi:hypothetical protein